VQASVEKLTVLPIVIEVRATTTLGVIAEVVVTGPRRFAAKTLGSTAGIYLDIRGAILAVGGAGAEAGCQASRVMIVVGINNTDRARDMTPTNPPRALVERPGNTLLGERTSSCPSSPMNFLPTIDRNYRTRPYRVLIGHSLGGLFTVYALMNRPEVLNAISSSVRRYGGTTKSWSRRRKNHISPLTRVCAPIST